MNKLQELLDEEARLSNSGNHDKAREIHTVIVLMRGHRPPACWGEDDCSTMTLLGCPWRIDCGNKLEET